MPEEKLTINEGSADLSGPDEATKDKISESILTRAKKEALRLKEETQSNFAKPDESLKDYLKGSRSGGEVDRKYFYDKKRDLTDSIESDKGSALQDVPAGGGVNRVAPDKFGEGRKQYIQSSEMERRKKKIQANKEKSFLNIKKRPQTLVRQMASLQANKNMILREGVREIREGDSKVDQSDSQSDNGSAFSDEGKEANLRLAKQNDKNKAEAKVKINQSGESKASKIKLATDEMLKKMILLIFATFTLSAFYVYLHVFLRGVFPSYFSKLGHEWVPADIKKKYPEQAERMGDKIGIAEKPAAGCFCLFHLFVIIILVAVIYFILNPWSVVWEFLYSIAEGAWEATKGWLGLGD